MIDDGPPTCEQLLAGVRAFEAKEPRAAVYYQALSRVSKGWADPEEMAAGAIELLHSWHQYFYHWRDLDPDKVRRAMASQFNVLDSFHRRSIATLRKRDEGAIAKLFDVFLEALRGRGESPVAVGKALHLCAPSFFPMWDSDIALAYGSFGAYLPFCWKMKERAAQLRSCACVRAVRPRRSLLKVIDEYNYARFTKRWLVIDPAGAWHVSRDPTACRA